jgi:AcrR family transcriptional regulator
MIVDATLPLLLQHGESVKTQEIAEAAGIAEGTIFTVFTSKDALIEATVERALDPEPVEQAIAAIDDSLGLECSVVQVVALLQQRVVDGWLLLSSVGRRYVGQTRRSSFESAALTALFKAHRAELGVTPDLAARLLRAITVGMTHPMMTSAPAAPAEIAHHFLHGVMRTQC